MVSILLYGQIRAVSQETIVWLIGPWASCSSVGDPGHRSILSPLALKVPCNHDSVSLC